MRIVTGEQEEATEDIQMVATETAELEPPLPVEEEPLLLADPLVQHVLIRASLALVDHCVERLVAVEVEAGTAEAPDTMQVAEVVQATLRVHS